MNTLSLRLLGQFQAFLDAEPLTDFRTRKVQALLIYLATETRPHNRDLLLDLLWPGLPERSARSNLRQIIYYLRQTLPDVPGDSQADLPVIIANRQDIQLNPRANVAVDTHQFETLLHKSQSHDHLDLFLCHDCRQDLERAVALYRGDFLSDFYLDDSNEYEEWAQARREHFRRQALDALVILATIATRRQDYAQARAFAERQLDIDNLRESAYRQLMEALALNGRREEALAAYESCRRVLREELGMIPAARTTELYEKILAGDLRFDSFPAQAVRGYELKEQIDEGAYGAIYRAVQPAVGREVAVKVIRRKLANDPDFIRRFEAEAQLVARLEHPYIVPLYDYWRDPDGAYLVMRYMRQGSLLSALKAGPWQPERAAELLEQIANALSLAHPQGVVHRDIKPGNILLDEAGNAYLSDFGIALNLGSAERMTAEGAVLGTLDYISPEQILNEAVSPQTDIYSLGAVLYETLTGEKPFGGMSVANVLYSHLHEPIPPVTATRPDVPVEVDDVLQKATAKKPAGRYADVLAMATAFRSAVHGFAPAAAGSALAAPVEIYNPYKGLRAFQEADADDFFGRESLVQQLAGRLGDESRFLAVVGPSGSGKSSVVKAGLIPALRAEALPGSGEWFVAEMVPGTHPLAELELALWPVAVDSPPSLVQPMQRDTGGMLRTIRRILPDVPGAQLLLVIDQFEELFTLVADEERRAFFLDSLLAAIRAPRSPLRVVVTLRADFYDRPLQRQLLGQLLKENTEIVLPLNHTELTWAICEPARRMGVRVEEGLAAAIVADVADQPGALPLLQYAMTELFERRQGNLITHAGYEQIGGVQSALGRRAEALYADLDESGQEVARQLCLRLVTLGEGAEDTRRRVLRSELEALGRAEEQRSREARENEEISNPRWDIDQSPISNSPISNVIDLFGRHRLLTFDRDPLSRAPTVEIAHEALLREWPRLRAWLAESRHDVRLQRILAQAAGEWLAAERDAGYLLRDARLDQFAGWAETTQVALTGHERAFIDAGVAAREQRLAVEEARRRRELQAVRELAETQQQRAEEQARAAQRLRQRALYLAGALVIAAVLAILAFSFARASAGNATLAATREAEALANAELAATREAEALTSAELAIARQVEAEAEADLRATAEVVAIQEQETAEQQARLATSRELSLAALNTLETDPELSILLALQALETAYTKEAEEALHRALQTSRTLVALTGHTDAISEVAFSADSSRLATASHDGTVKIWDAQTGRLLRTLPLADPGGFLYVSLEFSEAGTSVAALVTDVEHEHLDFTTWNALSGEVVITHALPITTDEQSFYALSPDWTMVAVDYENGSTDLWQVDTGRKLLTFPGGMLNYGFSLDGSLLATGTGDGNVAVWDVPASLDAGDGSAIVSFDSPNSAHFPRNGVFNRVGTHLALGFADGSVELWDLANTGGPQFTLTGLTNVIFNLDYSPDQTMLAAASADGTVAVWDTAGGELLYTLSGHSSAIWAVAFSPDGRTAATAGPDGTARIWEALPQADGELLNFAADFPIFDLELSPDEQMLALGSWPGPATVWDANTGQLLLTLAGEPDTDVYSVAFHPDGSRLAAVGEDNVIRIWDLVTGNVLLSWTGHGVGEPVGQLFHGTIDVDYSPDGTRLATAGTDGIAKVWDAASGDELLVLAGHTSGVISIAYSPDGRFIATGSGEEDTTVKVWDAVTGEAIYTLEGHSANVWGWLLAGTTTCWPPVALEGK